MTLKKENFQIFLFVLQEVKYSYQKEKKSSN